MKSCFASLRISLALAAFACVLLAPARANDGSEAWKRFQARVGPGLELRRADPASLEIVGPASVAGPIVDERAAELATRSLLVAAEELLGTAAENFAVVRQSSVAGIHVVQLEQRVGGLTVRGSLIETHWMESGALISLTARGLSRASRTSEFVLERDDAAELGRLSIPSADVTRLWARSPRRELVALESELRPVYSVYVWDPARPGAEWYVTLDGVDGTLRDVRSAVVEGLAGSVDGRGMSSGTLVSGPPATLPMGNIQVTAIDRSVGLVRITDNACGDAEVAMSSNGMRVAWISACDGDRELWTAASDGSGALQLTTNAADDHSPSISADGSLIVFVSNTDGDEELWSIQSDGSALTQLTFNSARDHAPSLSGDGARVAYISEADGDSELATLLVASPTPTQLTFDTTVDAAPRISSDGTRIVWVSWSDGDADVCTITPAGTGFVRVTLNSVEDAAPDITADGSRIVFASSMPASAPASGDPSATSFQRASGVLTQRARKVRELSSRDLFEAGADGSSLTRLTDSDADDRDPSYATAGGCVAYVTNEDGNDEIELIDVVGGTVMRLTEDAHNDRAPRVSSSCGRGAWVANDGDGEIFAWDLFPPGASATGFTDSAGAYTFAWDDSESPSVSTRLRGRYARVSDLDPRWSNARATVGAITPTATADLLLNPTGAVEGPTAQVSAYYHTNRAHDELATVLTRLPLSIPTPLAIDAPLKVNVNIPEATANAYYSAERRECMYFIGAGPSRPNTAYDTVILHEYGHYFDDVHGGMFGGSPCEAPGALSEGIGDTLAMFVSGQQIIGEDFFGTGTSIRDYTLFVWGGGSFAGGRQYGCEECTTEAGKPKVHQHGSAFAGFAWDLRDALGAITAENLIFGALTGNPPDMQSAVNSVFTLAASPAFGGTGDPTTSPHSGLICVAAARHGFDCMTKPDQGTKGCELGLCMAIAMHRSIGTEWLGALVDGELMCEPVPTNVDDDGLTWPSPAMSDETRDVTILLSVNPAMQSSGRYGPPTPLTQMPSRRMYLNGWIFIDDAMGGFTSVKVLGTGSTSPTVGPDNIGPGNTLAFNPDTWFPASTLAFPAKIKVPSVPTPRLAILRLRFDYGENAGAIDPCLAHPSYSGPCGIARFGELEDYQFVIMPP